MTQEELDAILESMGGAAAVKYAPVQETKTIKNPAHKNNGGTSYTVPEEIQVRISRWWNPKTGQVVEAYANQDGTYTVTRQGADKSLVDASEKPPAEKGRTRIEGTPDPSKPDGFDNERPVMVTRDASDKVIESRELTPAEMKEWRENRERSRNPGGKTDAELRAEGEEKTSQDPVNNRPGWVQITRIKGGNKTVTFRGPDGKEVDTLPSEDGTSSVQFVHTDGKTYYTIKRKTGNNVEEYTASDPEGKTRVTLPGKESRSSVQKRAPNGTVYYEVSVEKDGRKDSYTSSDPEGANRIPPPDPNAAKPLPPGMPQLDTSSPERARASYLAQVQWAQEQRRSGAMSSQEVQEILTPSHAAAQAVIDAEERRLTNERATRGQDITQEGNRLSAATNQYANAQKAVDDVWKIAPRGGSQASDVLMGTILLQQLMNQGIRGNVGAPAGAAAQPLTTPAAAAAAAGPTGVAAVDAAAASAPATDPQAAAKSEAAAVREAARAAGIPLPPPVFRPSPPAGTPSVQEPGPANMSPNQPDLSEQPLPVNPLPGEPGHDPTKPVGYRQPVGAVASAYGRSLVDSIVRRYGGAA